MTRAAKVPGLVIGMLLAMVMPVSAQFAPVSAISFATRETGGTIAAARREPIVAGALSLVFPFGTGSFYAGHPRHGVTHLLAGLVTSSAALGGAIGCGVGLLEGGESSTACGIAQIGALGFIVNWGWGVVTAVNDARAANQRPRVAGEVINWRPAIDRGLTLPGPAPLIGARGPAE